MSRVRSRSQAGTSVASTPVAVTADYTASDGDAVLADATEGEITVTLPAPAVGLKVTVKNVGASGGVTVAQHAAETVDGEATYPITSRFQSRDFLSDGTDWWVV